MKRLFVAVLATLLIACSSQEPPSPLTVNTAGNHYRNAFFGVSADLPAGWYAQPQEETIAMQQRRSAQMLGDQENKQAIIEASLKSSAPIFAFFKVPPGTPGEHNPNVMAVAENLAGFPGVKSGCDYLHFVKQLMLKGNKTYSFEGECTMRKLSGESFGFIEGHVTIGALTVTQRYYAAVRNHYALSFIQTYFSDEGEASTSAVLNSVVFEHRDKVN